MYMIMVSMILIIVDVLHMNTNDGSYPISRVKSVLDFLFSLRELSVFLLRSPFPNRNFLRAILINEFPVTNKALGWGWVAFLYHEISIKLKSL